MGQVITFINIKRYKLKQNTFIAIKLVVPHKYTRTAREH